MLAFENKYCPHSMIGSRPLGARNESMTILESGLADMTHWQVGASGGVFSISI